jgi:signal transduction histidine kinase
LNMPTMVLHATRLLLAGGVLFVAVLAFVASTATQPSHGMASGIEGRTVGSLEPGGPVWRAGIRPGDAIVEFRPPEEPGGWLLVARRGTTEYTSGAPTHLVILRQYGPWSVVAVVLAVVAALPAFRGHPAAAPVLPITYAIAAQPLFFSGSFVMSLFAGVTVFLAEALAVVLFARWRWWMLAVVAAGFGLSTAWVVAMMLQPNLFDAVDAARIPAAGAFSLVGFLSVVDRRRLRDARRSLGSVGYVDVAYVGVGAAFLIAAWLFGRVPPELLAVAALVVLGVYPIWRRNLVSTFERFVTSRARRDAAILAIEEERGRLARDIHDAPLQDLSGVIRRLDAVPGAEQEANALREVAARLRDVATALRPPVLQDLGLVAAIEDLGDQLIAGRDGWDIDIAIEEKIGDGRPPSDVELAALRVMQEAAANAVAHSDGRRLEIRGAVSTGSIDLTATDDGTGFREAEARDARRAGHFGLDSMRERAEAVDAETMVTSGPNGVSVRFHWVGMK